MKFFHFCCDSIFVIAVEECHEKVDDKENAEEQINNEEESEGTAVLVGGEHDVRTVRGCQKYKHIETGGHVVWEVHDALYLTLEDIKTQ